MRAFRLLEWGKPPELVDVPVPEPGPSEVLVRVGGVGACHSDLSIMNRSAGGPVPFTLGHETAGWVAAVGPGAGRLAVGDPVLVYISWACGRCVRCRQGLDHWCVDRGPMAGMGADGGLAEYQLVPSERYLVPLDGLDPRTAGPLADAGLTAYHAVRRSSPVLVGPGHTVLVIGVGGLGHMAVQIARAITTARIIAVDTDERKLALARRLGADAFLAGADAIEGVRELTKGEGASLVIDFVGTDATLAFAAASARIFGHLTLVGAAMGTLPLTFASIPKECSVAVTGMGSIPDLHEVVELARAGLIGAEVETFPLEQAPEVYRRLDRGEIVGRAVLNPATG
ncbi:NAD(P)-dependent alcohol dehydrogenase [Acrocarpospora macrocephala]|uniref:alcohol dehydrogenase n=1 Tax=Acrocarpospora macrocephala TaxID=150177 RepID=A0A5M3WL46_9ACTN|nr:NAD(P)-dependent alcohol dehydrogenase [Acrocarpospora macrocephala]GES09614.1 oxidoreductase [Acrocarpospora macrocephala]